MYIFQEILIQKCTYNGIFKNNFVPEISVNYIKEYKKKDNWDAHTLYIFFNKKAEHRRTNMIDLQ